MLLINHGLLSLTYEAVTASYYITTTTILRLSGWWLLIEGARKKGRGVIREPQLDAEQRSLKPDGGIELHWTDWIVCIVIHMYTSLQRHSLCCQACARMFFTMKIRIVLIAFESRGVHHVYHSSFAYDVIIRLLLSFHCAKCKLMTEDYDITIM